VRNTKRIILIVMILLFCALMQGAFLSSFTFCHAKPDLVLLFIVMLGLFNGVEEGMIYGLIAGLILAPLSSAPAGLLTGTYCLAGFCAGVTKEKIYPDNFVVPLITAILLSFLSAIMLAGGGLATGVLRSIYPVSTTLLPFLIINSLCAIPMGFLVRSKWITSRRPLE